jgi:hypothetical protein
MKSIKYYMIKSHDSCPHSDTEDQIEQAFENLADMVAQETKLRDEEVIKVIWMIKNLPARFETVQEAIKSLYLYRPDDLSECHLSNYVLNHEDCEEWYNVYLTLDDQINNARCRYGAVINIKFGPLETRDKWLARGVRCDWQIFRHTENLDALIRYAQSIIKEAK